MISVLEVARFLYGGELCLDEGLPHFLNTLRQCPKCDLLANFD